jgi:hypothetical protein
MEQGAAVMVLMLVLLALASSAQAQTASSWDGVWSGVWPSGSATSVTISGRRPLRYVVDGKDQPISGSTTASAKTWCSATTANPSITSF